MKIIEKAKRFIANWKADGSDDTRNYVAKFIGILWSTIFAIVMWNVARIALVGPAIGFAVATVAFYIARPGKNYKRAYRVAFAVYAIIAMVIITLKCPENIWYQNVLYCAYMFPLGVWLNDYIYLLCKDAKENRKLKE